jgi:protein-arginine kinase
MIYYVEQPRFNRFYLLDLDDMNQWKNMCCFDACVLDSNTVEYM